MINMVVSLLSGEVQVGVQPLAFQKGLSCIKLSGLTINSFKEFSKSEGF